MANLANLDRESDTRLEKQKQYMLRTYRSYELHNPFAYYKITYEITYLRNHPQPHSSAQPSAHTRRASLSIWSSAA